VSVISQRFGGSPTSARPPASTLSARGSTSLSAKTVRLSIVRSPLVSSSTTTLLIGSRESLPEVSGMKPAISTTHIRPSASKSIRIGSITSGSLATSSTRYPGGTTIVARSCSGVSTGAFSGVLRTAPGHAFFV
jgi:hypothetical protein